MLFCATVTDRTHWTVIRLNGELDLHTAAEAGDTIEREMECGAGRVVLDLASLRFIDTSGAGAILRSKKKAEQIGVDLVVANPGALAMKVLEVVGIRDVIGAPAPLAS